MAEIRILDPIVANQIAAGEVVERPASVIKELVENAIDAGATLIQVEADEGGRFLRVVDNGSGIPAESVALAFQRFATSKLTAYDDIWQLGTMGFRGEALPSIASVSRVEVLSRVESSELGHRLLIHGGDLLESGPAGGPVGTSLTIRELFYNTPARLKFMSSENTELGYIQQLLQAFALGFPQIGFRFTKKAKPVINTTGRSDMMGVVRQVFGKDLASSLFSIEHVYRDARVEGVLSYPDYVRKDRNHQYFFVNQRWVKVPALTKILEDLYADLVPKRHYPVAILKLDLPPETVDVNVHPTKREVRFKNFSLVYQLLKEALNQALERYHPERAHLLETPKPQPETIGPLKGQMSGPAEVPPFAASESQPFAADPAERPPFAAGASPAPSASYAPQADAPPFAAARANGMPLADPPASYSHTLPSTSLGEREGQREGQREEEQRVGPGPSPFPVPQSPASAPRAESRGTPPQVLSLPGLSPLDQMQYRQARDSKADEQALLETIVPIGQACENTYIIGRFGRDLVLIDQHVAEERHLYEALLEKGELARQPLLVSVIVELDAIDKGLLETHPEVFEAAGFEYEAYGPDTIAIRALPHTLRYADAEVTFRALLADLRETDVADSRLESYKRICKTIACHSAIRAGDPLSIEQIREIVKNWSRTKNPYTCPHGRPILLKLSKEEINKRFLRTWS